MLFQTQKKLFTDSVARVTGALQKSTDPTDPSQYTVLSSDGNALTMTSTGKSVVARLVIDKAGSDLNLDPKFTYVVAGDVLRDILSANNALDKVTVEFAPSAANDILKSADPNKNPVGLLGNLVVKFPVSEVWDVPVVDQTSINVPTNPNIELKGKDRITVDTKTFKKLVAKIEMTVGADDAHPAFRNMMIRTKGDTFEVITVAADRTGIGRGSTKKTSGDFLVAVPYVDAKKALEMLDEEQDVEIIANKGTPGTVVFSQPFLYGDRAIGNFAARITSPQASVANIDNVIKGQPSFLTVVKFKTKQAVPVCAKLSIPRLPQTMVEVDTSKNLITLTKSDPSRVKMRGVTIPITSVTGEPFQLKFLSPMMSLAILAAENDEIEWGITGPKSLSRMVLSDDLTVYFPPIPEK